MDCSPGRAFIFNGPLTDGRLTPLSAAIGKAARDDSQSGFSGELLGLTRGCDLRKEGVTVTSQEDNPDNRLSN
ncbi:MAG: hypothetical protein ABR607_02425 [Pyrinomonadaceae bacterium]